MKVLLDILHPADLHMLRPFREEMIRRGHKVHVVARDKDLTIPLLERYGIPAEILSSQRTGRFGLLIEWIMRSLRLVRVARRFRPDVFAGLMGPSIAPIGRIMRVPSIVFYDTENASRTNRFVYPIATAVVTPDCYMGRVRGRHITYAGYHELAYLHPGRFQPDLEVVRECGVDPNEWYAIVRFVSWEASHDLGETGLTDAQKSRLVDRLSQHGRVLISSESPLPSDLEAHRLTAPPEAIHHLMAFARIVVGESATMASEAVVMGIPAVFIADTGRGYTHEQEHRYALVRKVSPADIEGVEAAIDEFLACPIEELAERHRKLLADKIDTTVWMVDFVEQRKWETSSEPN